MEYILIRSRRKTAALYIRDGGVEVRAPLRLPKRDIDRFVDSKSKWIADKLALSQERAERRENFMLTYGSSILYRGEQYYIMAKSGKRAGFDGKYFYVPPGLAPDLIKAACVRVYRILARRVLTDRTLALARQMRVSPAAVRITGARTRWGSCSTKKNINYSWKLIMAEDNVIDYVIVHELAHLTEMNHSMRFWKIVEGALPDYAVRRARLRELQRRLAREVWDE